MPNLIILYFPIAETTNDEAQKSVQRRVMSIDGIVDAYGVSDYIR
jgi:hypothetical protein